MRAYEFTTNTGLEVSKGLIPNHHGVNKYGETINVDNGIDTDIWDGANPTDDQDVWVAPTEARIQDIVSDDATDVAGLGTLTLADTLEDGDTITIGTKVYTAELILTDVDGNFFIEPDATATNILTFAESAADTNTVTIGGKVYTFQLILTDVDGNVFIEPDASATQTLTLTENAADTNTVTIGSHVYTFQTVLTDSADNVLIGASASDSIDNLIAAINGGAGAGTLYGTGTPTNTDVTAAIGAGDTMDVTAITAGTAANSVATTDTLAGASAWGAATLTGGTNDVSVTIDNFIAAINGDAGAGTKYAASMTTNTDLTAAAGTGDTMDVTAITAGTAANSVATTDTLAGASAWTTATLEGGTNDVSVTIDNLIAAINLGAGSGTKYAASMTANSDTSSAAQGAGDTMSLFSNVAIATTETSSNASWGGALTVLGAGARSTEIWGLISWHLEEVTEIVFNRGLTSTPTTNSYVIIHRKRAVGNAGRITATAQVDGTMTSLIQAGNGKTLMAILGIPSTQSLHLDHLQASIIGSAANVQAAAMTLLVNPEPDIRLDKFIHEHKFSAVSTGSSNSPVDYRHPKRIDGPAIVKIQADGSANDMIVAGWFMGTLTPQT